ncbi:hypothetical protein B5M09_008473 [Aphanomyces astaci]|uniref:Uncharacterized protein n=1 Tax=Aphanomyces astaci TaxID=112090 RepID=A0A3R7X8H8_APHAT|nr:hypothetical protein B5M09_008473 [Aphanomyces astaci]
MLMQHVSTSSAANAAYISRLQDTIHEHTSLVHPDAPGVAQFHYEREFPIWKKQQVSLHSMREGHAKTILQKYANENLLWQEARDLNAAQRHDLVVDVLYRALYLGERDAAWLPRTTSLFAQQVLVAACNLHDVATAVQAVDMLTALPLHAVSRKVLQDASHAVTHLCLHHDDATTLTAVLDAIEPAHVTLDASTSEQVVSSLLRNEGPLLDTHKRIVSLYNAGTCASSLAVDTHVLWSLLTLLRAEEASSSRASTAMNGVDPHLQLVELYRNMQAEYGLTDPDVGNYLVSDSCKEARTPKTQGRVSSIALSYMRDQGFPASVSTTLNVVMAMLASDDAEDASSVWDTLFNDHDAAVFPWSTQHVSAALSAAALHGHSAAAMALVHRAQLTRLPLLDVSYGHAVATASDPRLRSAFVDQYKAANQAGDVVMACQDDETHVGFHWSGALLHHIAATHEQLAKDVVPMLLQEMQYYGIAASERDMAAVLSTLTSGTLYDLYERFPRVVKAAPKAWAAAMQARVLPASSDESTLDDAMQLWRCFVWTEALQVDESVFAALYYVALRRTSTWHLADEVMTQYTTRHRTKTTTSTSSSCRLVEQALGHAADAVDLPTTKRLLRQWTAHNERLSRDAVACVFRTVGQVRSTRQPHVQDESLSYFSLMVEFPGLFPLDPTTVSNALVLSAQADLYYDCQALLTMAMANGVDLTPEARFACVELLTRTNGVESSGDRQQLLATVRQLWQNSSKERVDSIQGLR